jgi:hypothetical protein
MSGAGGTGMPIEADLHLGQGRIQGTIVNHTSHTIRSLQLLAASGTQAPLAPELGPGATATIDAALSLSSSGTVMGKGVIVAGAQASPGSPGQAVMLLAASQASGQTGQLALVGITDATDTVTVDGQRPARTARAAVVEPVDLRSTDSANGVVAPARLVSSVSARDGGQLDVYELPVPPGLEDRAGVSAGLVPGPPAAISVDVYDWTDRTWRTLPGSPVPGAQSPAMALTAGERAGGLIRLRVHESQPGQAFIALADLP